MPTRAVKPCSYPGCPALVTTRQCEQHRKQEQKDVDIRRAGRTDRAYYHTATWQRLRLMVLRRDPLCTWPEGCLKRSTDADHIVDRVDGGPDSLENLRGLCHRHHSKKTAREGGAFGNKKSA